MSDDIWVSQKVEHRASGAYFEKDSDGDIILCGYYLNKQCIESFKEFLHRVLRELGDGDASAAPEAKLEDIFGNPRIVSKAKRESTLEPYEERCSHLPCNDDIQDKLSVSPGIVNGVHVEVMGRGDVWVGEAEQWARFANEVFALLGGEFVVARKVRGDS